MKLLWIPKLYGLVTNKANENKKIFSHPNLINIGRYFLLYLFISRTSRVVTTDKHISDRQQTPEADQFSNGTAGKIYC